jgi:hypothetical protein
MLCFLLISECLLFGCFVVYLPKDIIIVSEHFVFVTATFLSIVDFHIMKILDYNKILVEVLLYWVRPREIKSFGGVFFLVCT